MTRYEKVRSTVCPDKISFDEKSVWVTENITALDSEDCVFYEFDQTRYTKDEYIKLIDNKNAELEAQVTDTQLALCEVYELML